MTRPARPILLPIRTIPKIIYASMWQVHRMPWDIDEFGPGSGIYKTTDGGDHWTQLVEGFPKTDMGKIGLSVSPVNTDRVWATIGGEEAARRRDFSLRRRGQDLETAQQQLSR